MTYQQLQERPFLIAGPCVIESRELVLQVAEQLRQLQEQFNFTIIFKASFDKANRTSLSSFRGNGMEEGLAILAEVREKTGLPILTDIHESYQAKQAAEVVDVLQIPAFLCRQTDLLIAAGETGKIVNIKKAQFLAGHEMQFPCKKVAATGNHQILLTERGTMFGYNNLVVDYTNLLEMMQLGYPVVFDATHSVQKPGAAGGQSGGNRKYVPPLANAAAAVGVRGFFMETHPNPNEALSDGANMVFLKDLGNVLHNLQTICALNLKKIDN